MNKKIKHVLKKHRKRQKKLKEKAKLLRQAAQKVEEQPVSEVKEVMEGAAPEAEGLNSATN